MQTTTAYLQPESGTVYHFQPRSASTIYMQDVNYSIWVSSTEKTCNMVKAVWGLAITLTWVLAPSSGF